MKEPKLSSDGNCPACSCGDWKLAKMMVLAGVTHIDTESSGGGFGISAGLGRGHGGAGVNYQGINLSTTGSHSTAAAEEYAAPVPSDMNEYLKKDYWIKECSRYLDEAAKGIFEIDGFAANCDGIKLGLFKRVHMKSIEEDFVKSSNHLLSIQDYERKKAIWDRTRVCTRCGESFTTAQDIQLAQATFEVPEFSFEGKDRCCPHCNDYPWKTAEAFFSIKIRELQEQLERDRANLQAALDYANNPSDGGVWKKLKNKLLTLKPEDAEKNVEKTVAAIATVQETRDRAIEQYSDLNILRACAMCEKLYVLAERRSD